jgi:hypothetical protein
MSKEDVLERRPRVRAYLSSIREGLIRDMGPREQDLTTAELALINHTISKLGVLRLIEEHIQGQGVFTAEGLLDPALGKFWLAASNSLRLDLTALGIHTKKGEEPLDLGRYVDLHDKERGASVKGDGLGDGGEEIDPPASPERELPGIEPTGEEAHD